MPYTKDSPDLPTYVKELPEGDRARWSAIWNEVYSSCEADNGEDCEAKAFKQANGVVLKGDEQVDNVQANVVDKVYRTSWDGKTWLVVPTVMIKEGVLNGELVPADELAKYPSAWNGRPFVIDHPKDGETPISASDPKVLQQYQAGYIFGAEYRDSDKSVPAEVWLDLERAMRLPGGPELINRVKNNKPIEVSTGYFRDRQDKTGDWNGKPYDGIARNLRPDHLAALLDSVGACSWQDGCGCPRVNQENECAGMLLSEPSEMVYNVQGEIDDVEANVAGKARKPTYSGTSSGEWSAPTLEDYASAYDGDAGEGGVADRPTAFKRWVAAHSLLGTADAETFRDLSFFPVVGTDGKLYGTALRAVLGGRGSQANIPTAARDSAQAMARRLLEDEFGMEQKENQAWNAIKTFLGALGINVGGDAHQEVEQMARSKDELVGDLCKRLELNADEKGEEFSALSADTLRAILNAMQPPEKEPDEEEPEEVMPEEQQPEDQEEETEDEEVEPEPEVASAEPSTNEQPCADARFAAMEKRIKALEKRNGDLVTRLEASEDVVRQHQEAQASEKARLVSDLSANERCAYSKDELESKSLTDLQKLSRSLIPASYAGQEGGPMTANKRDDRPVGVWKPRRAWAAKEN